MSSSLLVSRRTLSQSAPDHLEIPDLQALIDWLASWIQDSGAINGFHNHSVWGENPYRWLDFTSGHSTFSSLLLPLLARLDARGTEGAGVLLDRALSFQLDARQENGEFAHVGFQIGESCTGGLIHNMVPCVALLLTLQELSPSLRSTFEQRILAVVSEVLDVCNKYGEAASSSSIANQEYARQWVRLCLAVAAKRPELLQKALSDLEILGANFFVPGLPDSESCGCLRVDTPTPQIVEPAEYYGLMIEPLLLAHEQTENPVWLEQATKLTRHIIRSSWVDPAGMRRVHRLYYKNSAKAWAKINEPMLVSGMGFTLESIRKCALKTGDPEMAAFVADCHRTLAHYQHPTGFFLAATGWNTEADVSPCTAWHSHDAWHLLQALDVIAPKIQVLPEVVSLVLGDNCYYAECGQHWRIGDYATQCTYGILGRKDQAVFGRDMMWIGGPHSLPSTYNFPYTLNILKTDSQIIFCGEPVPGLRVLNAALVPFEVPLIAESPAAPTEHAAPSR